MGRKRAHAGPFRNVSDQSRHRESLGKNQSIVPLLSIAPRAIERSGIFITALDEAALGFERG